MDWPTMVEFIKGVGFPIAVAAFVLWRLNGKVERMAMAMEKLEHAINNLIHHNALDARRRDR